MAKPIYAGSYPSRGRWKRVFGIVVLLHVAGVGFYFAFRDKEAEEPAPQPAPTQPIASMEPAPLAPIQPVLPEMKVVSPEASAIVADAKAMVDGGQLVDAKKMLDDLTAKSSDSEAIKLLGQVNMQLLKSPMMMPGKEYYVIQSGDYLQKIARKYNTTVVLIKKMNGMETDNIRAGARLMVFNGKFILQVSKSRNELDLLLDGAIFKRYAVGTGEFGKTPAVTFSLIDKIVEPPWTRPTDNKHIEYGDPENVLGTRWMALKSTDHPELTGFGIHGTWERDSIGKQSSAGCIRMLNEDVEELFDLVPRKTVVKIVE